MRNRLLPLLALAALVHLAALPRLGRAKDPQVVDPPWAKNLGPTEAPANGTGSVGEVSEEKAEEEHHPELFAEPEEHPLFWLRGDFLLWWTKNGNIPALLTTGPNTDPLPGALGQVQTKILYGGDVAFHDRNGSRITLGSALGRESGWSVEGNFFFLNARQTGATLASTGNPVLARPFFDVVNSAQNSSLDSYPGLISGGVDIENRSYLWGGEANLQYLLCDQKRWHVQALAGFRYLGLIESLDIREDTQVAATAAQFPGDNVRVADHFGVSNNFYGGQLGLRTDFQLGHRLVVNLLGKVALGDSRETVNIHGQTAIGSTNLAGGLFALSSNSGSFSRNTFAVVPELGANLGLRLTPRLTALVGYTFIYWSRVVRPGDQVDTSVNPNLVPTSNTFGAGGPQRPAFAFHETDFWAQGVNLGLEFRY